jgi:hypothetical protein
VAQLAVTGSFERRNSHEAFRNEKVVKSLERWGHNDLALPSNLGKLSSEYYFDFGLDLGPLVDSMRGGFVESLSTSFVLGQELKLPTFDRLGGVRFSLIESAKVVVGCFFLGHLLPREGINIIRLL